MYCICIAKQRETFGILGPSPFDPSKSACVYVEELSNVRGGFIC